jgi:hypothetical protein
MMLNLLPMAYVISWSPDSQWIIYRDVIRMTDFHSTVLESTGLYAVSLAGTDRFIFRSTNPMIIPALPDWLSNDQFITQERGCDPDVAQRNICPPRKIILVDISNGSNETIYSSEELSVNVATDPSKHLLLMNSPTQSLPRGVYQFDLKSRSLTMLLEGEYYGLSFDSILNSFRVRRDDGSYNLPTTLIRYLPGHGFEIEKDSYKANYSLDLQWFFGQQGEDWFILDAQGNPIQKTVGSNCGWSPDSKSLTCFDMDSDPQHAIFYVYLKDSGWRPRMIRQLDYFTLMTRWISP